MNKSINIKTINNTTLLVHTTNSNYLQCLLQANVSDNKLVIQKYQQILTYWHLCTL